MNQKEILDELLERINKDLNLHLEDKKNSYDSYNREKTSLQKDLPLVSFFYSPISNTIPYTSMNPFDIYKLIKGNRYLPRTQRLRALTDPTAAAKFKQNSFDYITPAGVFSKRNDKAFLRSSCLIVFDFDMVKDPSQLKMTLIGDPNFNTILTFISPSGIGLKWIISVDLTICTHEEWFTAVANYSDTTIGEKVDRSGKDISRACFLCHDPEVYIHPYYLDYAD